MPCASMRSLGLMGENSTPMRTWLGPGASGSGMSTYSRPSTGRRLFIGDEDVGVRPLRSTSFEEQLLERQRALRNVRRMLHDQRVAEHEIGAGDACELIVGEVPRLDAEEHAQRRVFDYGFAARHLQLFGGQKRLCVVRVVLQNVGAQVDLAPRLGEQLAHLERDVLRELLALLAEDLDSILKDLFAVGQGALAPIVAVRVLSLGDDGL